MRKISFILIATSLILFSCSTIKNNKSKSVVTDNLSEKLEGYWISDIEEVELKKHEIIIFYGEIDDSKTGIYLQGEKEMKYRIIKIDNTNDKIEIAIKYSSSRERTETLTFSNNYKRISNNLVTPYGTSIDTYYVRKE